jgi:hypothetical protein
MRDLTSYFGDYNVLARVIPNCSSILDPHGDKIAGRPSQEKLEWTDELYVLVYFANTQTLIKMHKAIVLTQGFQTNCGLLQMGLLSNMT